MNNPDPFARAWRLEKRRKELKCDNTQCFYCGENDVFCLEEDHPVTEELDAEFTRIVCRNCHRKLEISRDVAGLTKNGRRAVKESRQDRLRRYLLLQAQDNDSMANRVLSPDISREAIRDALLARAASLRRLAAKV